MVLPCIGAMLRRPSRDHRERPALVCEANDTPGAAQGSLDATRRRIESSIPMFPLPEAPGKPAVGPTHQPLLTNRFGRWIEVKALGASAAQTALVSEKNTTFARAIARLLSFACPL